MTTAADIAVVGGGIAGLSLAAAIGSRARTVVLEAEPRLFQHTSSRSAQQMQPTYGPAPVRALTAASIPLVEERARRAGVEVLTPRPLVWADADPDPAAFERLLATVPGLDDLGPDEAVRRLPVLERRLLRRAAIDPSAVEVDVPVLLDWYRADAVAAGARVLTGATLTAADRRGDVWRLSAGPESVEAPVVVDAAGAWADRVAAMLGARPRGLVPTRRTVVVAAPARRVDPAWPMAADVADRFYFRPRGTAILASALEDVPSEPEDARPSPGVVDLVLERVNAATDLGLGAVVVAWTGLRTLAADGVPVVGFDGEVPGVYWLAGQGGYGIQTSAALARLAAADLLGDPVDVDGLDGVLAALSPHRALVPALPLNPSAGGPGRRE